MNNEIRSLTGIRFFAAIHVVLYHNLYLFGEYINLIPSFIRTFINYGESAVAFFFILSGFILTHVYKNKLENKEQKKKYFISRIAKLYPLYILGFLLDIPRVFSYFFNTYDSTTASLKIAISSIGYFSMIQSWIPNLTPVWNSPAWSLSCEIFFYISLIFTLKPILNFKYKNLLLSTCFLIPIVLFFILENTIGINSAKMITLWRSLPLLRLFEFIIGILIYDKVFNKTQSAKIIEKYDSLSFWGSLILSIAACLIFTNIDEKLMFHIFLVPLFSIMIMSASFDKFKFKEVFNNTVINKLGFASFSLYIIHQPIKYYFELFLTPSLKAGMIYTVGVILVSLILFKYFEVPLQRKIKNKFK